MMRNKFNKYSFILLIGLVLIGCEPLLMSSCQPTKDDLRRQKNLMRIKQLKVGMDSIQVRRIFGNPDSRYVDKSNGVVFYNYVLPKDYESESPAIQIQIGTSDGKVMEIYPP